LVGWCEIQDANNIYGILGGESCPFGARRPKFHIYHYLEHEKAFWSDSEVHTATSKKLKKLILQIIEKVIKIT